MAFGRGGQFLHYVLDQLAELGAVRARRMFGGFGLYRGDDFFAIIHRDTLYFKVDDRNRGVYERHGMAPFTPFPNRPVTLAYFAVPAEVIEDPNMLAEWARGAIDAARTRDKPRRGTRG